MFEKKVPVDELIKLYEKNWQPLGYLSEEHRKERYDSGKALLEDYYKRIKNEKHNYVALEKPFNIKVDGVRFYGRIDRIDHIEGEPDNVVEIVDYKTGSAKAQKDVDKDMQVAIYAIGAKEGLGLEPKLLSLYFLEADKKITTTRTQEYLENTKDKLKNIIGEIKSGKFGPIPGPTQCSWCDFKNICPFAYKG
jgi:DNA helicase-2/ATP-dependent DNA helicase PcrA